MEPLLWKYLSVKTAESILGRSVYTELVRIVKGSTTEYCNMRLTLKSKCV